MSIVIRKFNEYGIREFENMLSNFKAAKSINEEELYKLVFDDNYTSTLEEAEPLNLEAGNNKYFISKSLTESLHLEIQTHLYYDQGLWSWLSALMLNRLVPYSKKTGEREFKEKALYILETNSWNRYYRHLLAFPCWIYSTLQDKGRIFLRGTIYERGEIVEQLASVHDIQRNPSIVEAATLLYYNPEKDDIHRGAASKNIGGTARRFREVIQQFKMTYDLNAMHGNQISDILPKEFDRWKKHFSNPEMASAL